LGKGKNMKIEELLREGKKVLEKNNIEEASIISRSLLQYVLKIDRNKLVINKDEEVENNKENEYIGYIKEVAAGKPVQYITNKQEFMGLSFFVDENVLIPQPDTEILVEEAIKYANQIKENVEILDMCTGSGCIGVALAKHVKNAKVTLVDISTKALEVAKKNAKENEVKEKVNFIQSDMFENIKSKFDVIVSNPPYIKTKVINELDLQVQNEPHLALDGGENGLKFYEILINEAPKYLKENGKIFLEIGYDQKKEVEELARNSKLYKEIETVKDLANNDRVIELKR
jgi:protein-(glutamine-N5) methyltransferase, release factor-specific